MALDTLRIADLGGAPVHAWEATTLAALRTDAYQIFESLNLPDEEDEDWKYTDASRIDLAALSIASAERDAPRIDLEKFTSGATPGTCPVVMDAMGAISGGIAAVDGRVVAQALDDHAHEIGVEFGGAATFSESFAEGTWHDGAWMRDKFGALAAFASGGGAYMRIPEGACIEAPFVVWLNCDTPGLITAPFSRIRLERASEAKLVIHQMSSASAAALQLPITEVSVGAGASLDLVVIQEFGPAVDQIGSITVTLERDARVRLMSVTAGGGLSRLRTECSLRGEGAESEMFGVSLGQGASHIDHRTLQDHLASRTSSDLLFKTVVDDSSSSVYSGLIRVEKDIGKVVGYQANRNLILSEEASAESIPSLEILANDVRCSHASATGPIDDEQVYYLASRGIAPDVAERLLVLGFLGEVVDQVPVGSLAPALRGLLTERISNDRAGHGGTDD